MKHFLARALLFLAVFATGLFLVNVGAPVTKGEAKPLVVARAAG